MPDPFYDYWNDLLDGKSPPFYDGKPQGGVYAMKRGATRVPVRIDKDEAGKVRVWVNGDAASDGEVNRLWLSCGRNAVAWDVYEHRMQTGRWPDEASRGGDEEIGQFTDNQPPPEAVHELLPYEVERISAWFDKIGTFSSSKDVQAAADHVNVLRTLIGRARKQHKEEKAPHLAAGKAVDERYLPRMKEADALLARMGQAVAAFEAGQRKARQAEQARLASEAAKAAAKLQEATEAPPETRADAVQQATAEFGAASAALDAATGPAKIKSSTGGRGFTVKTVSVAKIVDQDALYNAVKDRAEIVALLAKIAQAELDSGTLLPGVERTQDVVAK